MFGEEGIVKDVELGVWEVDLGNLGNLCMKNVKKEEKRGEEKLCKGFCGYLKIKCMESVGLRVKR